MRVHRIDSAGELASLGAALVREALRGHDTAILLAAAGQTPTGVYRELCAQPTRDWRPRRLIVAALDEYWQAPRQNPASFAAYLRTHLVEPLGLANDALLTPDTELGGVAACARDYASRLAAAAPVQCALLGVGRNGHLAFIEPAASLPTGVHVAELSPETIADNNADIQALGEHTEAPARVRGVSVGMADVFAARRVILLATGAHKRKALRGLLNGDLSTREPVSLLRLHPNCDLVADAAALGEAGRSPG